MDKGPGTLSSTFGRFFDSEKSGGYLLIACTVISLVVANSPAGPDYVRLWQAEVGGMSLAHWINDALMAVFFLLIGLELERELYVGELSDLNSALLPVAAAVGGMLVPALVHLSLNQGLPTQAGFGIPMATDIAFALGVLAILGKRIPASMKVFVVAFAVMDDLGAIIIIAAYYTAQLSVWHLAGALAVWILLVALNQRFRVMALTPYVIGGGLIWLLMLKSGVHATIAGVLLAFAIPFTSNDDDTRSPSHKLEHFLQKPVAFIILPLFALANMGIAVPSDWVRELASPNSVGIAVGLIAGKPLGVTVLCFFAVAGGLCRLPAEMRWPHVIGAGMLGGIGFTMAIFIANVAFPVNPDTIVASKISIMLASLTAGSCGLLWLWLYCRSSRHAKA